MTYDHCVAVEQALAEQGLDIRGLKLQDRFICTDAARTLYAIMPNNTPDEQRFRSVVGEVIGRAKSSGAQNVRAFGEMVSLVFGANPAAALRLEELWNDLLDEEQICLLCTYLLAGPQEELAPDLCSSHTHYVV
jgi:hypothetical protein